VNFSLGYKLVKANGDRENCVKELRIQSKTADNWVEKTIRKMYCRRALERWRLRIRDYLAKTQAICPVA
jgi:hypothetical protein